MTDNFDWTVDDSVVLHEQPATAIYCTKSGSVLMRQRLEDEDVFIFIRPENVQLIVDALFLARLDASAKESPEEPAQKDRTAKERMRRYRKRHRNADRNNVTTLPLP